MAEHQLPKLNTRVRFPSSALMFPQVETFCQVGAGFPAPDDAADTPRAKGVPSAL